jgi:hypothetical protein
MKGNVGLRKTIKTSVYCWKSGKFKQWKAGHKNEDFKQRKFASTYIRHGVGETDNTLGLRLDLW